MATNVITLLDEATTTGAAFRWPDGRAYWMAWGVFDGATATLQVSPDGGATWIDAAAGVTDGAAVGVDLPVNGLVRVQIAAGTAPEISSTLTALGPVY